ncbi:MAG TPA: carboxypeptidase regulatory-like domain-containing protein, partial [Blastocatellia bacterium]|nr:carboxypeptidase regulatory-like domain-containing protein [Blastocatellia bacterium]
MNTANRSLILMLRVAACVVVLCVTAGAARQTRPTPSELTGIVVDPSGAVISDATVVLRRQDHPEQEVRTGLDGRFRFSKLTAGAYEIEVRKDGFKPAIANVNTAKLPVPLRLVLPIAELHEEIRVDDRPNQVNTDPAENLNVTKLDREELKKLPVLGNDVIGGLARLLDDGLVGTDGPTIVIDGLERPGARIPASQIQEVRINQNPYSAEFSRPGRGRIEVITKPGEPEYHGEFNFVFRDHRFDARNSFATERPREQRRVFEGTLSGPLGGGEKTSFLFGVDREEEDLQAVV